MNRIKTGIKGFDELISGGIPEGFNVLLTGRPGTGKTIFGLEYLYYGAKNGEKGIYVAFDSTINMLKEQAKQFGWDLDEMEKSGKIYFLKVPISGTKFNLFENVSKIRKDMGAKRVVLDNLAMFAINMDFFTIPLGYSGNMASSVSITTEDRDISGKFQQEPKMGKNKVLYKGDSEKRMVYLIIDELSRLGTTNLIITSEANASTGLTVDGVSEFACDGIIRLEMAAVGETLNRTLDVSKMRKTKIDGIKHTFDFDQKVGIAIEQ